MVSVDANLAQLRPALPPHLHHHSLLRPDFSLDIILENGSHTTNTRGIFQLYYLWRKKMLLYLLRSRWSGARCTSANGKQMQTNAPIYKPQCFIND